MLSTVLIIDRRKELSIKYKKSIENNQTSVIISKDLKDAIFQIQAIEPNIIIVSDSIEEDLANFCEKVRALTFNTRPVIVALSKSADANDRIKVLDHGADDFLSEPVNIDEFKTRIRAHIRRDLESNLDSVTLLPNKKFALKALKRLLHSNLKPAILLVSVENLQNYKSVYSDVAGDKLLQTFTAIAKSALEENDFIGQVDDNDFVIITNPYCAEKMAEFLTFAFDAVSPKFYSPQDVERGYMLIKGNRQAGMRVNFVSILIGGIIDNLEKFTSVESILERLYSIKKIAKIPNGSNYAIDRIKLTGANAIEEPVYNNTIFIKEKDEALALLLKTTLELQGYDVIEEFEQEKNILPHILIVDTESDLSGLDFCKKLAQTTNVGIKFSKTKDTVCVSLKIPNLKNCSKNNLKR